MQIESVNNSVARPVPKYNSSPGGNNKTLENLIWLISLNKEQALLLLHQYTQGIIYNNFCKINNNSGSHYGACPNMGNLISTMTEEKWPYELLLLNTICTICNNQYYNNWYSCARRQAMVNTHPGLMEVRRQHYFMVKLIVKYQVNNYGIKVPFLGQPGVITEVEEYKVPNVSLPKDLQIKKFIRHGK